MITNERQYKITRTQVEKLRHTIDSFDVKAAAKRLHSSVLANAELDALQSEFDNLFNQIQEYETLKSGTVQVLKASSLEKLPNLLIRGRIARGLSQRELAERIGVREQQIQRYEAEKYASASLSRLSDIAHALRLNISEIAEFRSVSEQSSDVDLDALPWDQFPVKEMYRRNWFEDFSGSLPAAVANSEELVKDFVKSALDEPVRAAARQRVRAGGIVNWYALLAWKCRVLTVAKRRKSARRYRRGAISPSWLADLVHLSRSQNGPKEAIEFLWQSGIRAVIEPHLSQTHLDGAAFLLPDGSPVLGLTLRHDRLDNFWFVLIHELIHVDRHLDKGRVESIFDDLDAEADQAEREADEITGEVLIPDAKWQVALPRYVRSKGTIEAFAAELRIHPAIVAGKIRREACNYTILVDLVGQGEVRRLFPDVQFS